MSGPNVLFLDCETSPIVAHCWGLFDQNVGLSQLITDPFIIGVGVSVGGKRPKYLSTWDEGGRTAMLTSIHGLLDEADVVVHYNGDRFDLPWLGGEFAREGMTPPSPYKSIDLYKVGKRNFRFPSHKLQYVSTALGLAGKHDTGGHQLWVDCLNGDEAARRKMARYCIQDVALLPLLLEKMRPWLGNQVNFALWSEQGVELACQKCGSENLKPKGTAHTARSSFPQYRCADCGGWTRDTRNGEVLTRAVGSTR